MGSNGKLDSLRVKIINGQSLEYWKISGSIQHLLQAKFIKGRCNPGNRCLNKHLPQFSSIRFQKFSKSKGYVHRRKCYRFDYRAYILLVQEYINIQTEVLGLRSFQKTKIYLQSLSRLIIRVRQS